MNGRLSQVGVEVESLRREFESKQSKVVALAGVNGMIEVAKGVEVLAERVRELEGEAKGIETMIKDKAKAVERIDYVLSKVKHRLPEPARTEYEGATPSVSNQVDEFLFELEDSGRKTSGSRKAAGRQ